jgi:hypothetical protein
LTPRSVGDHRTHPAERPTRSAAYFGIAPMAGAAPIPKCAPGPDGEREQGSRMLLLDTKAALSAAPPDASLATGLDALRHCGSIRCATGARLSKIVPSGRLVVAASTMSRYRSSAVATGSGAGTSCSGLRSRAAHACSCGATLCRTAEAPKPPRRSRRSEAPPLLRPERGESCDRLVAAPLAREHLAAGLGVALEELPGDRRARGARR